MEEKITLPRMMPGQKSYTEEEWKIVSKWIHDAAAGDPGEDREAEVLKKYNERKNRK